MEVGPSTNRETRGLDHAGGSRVNRLGALALGPRWGDEVPWECTPSTSKAEKGRRARFEGDGSMMQGQACCC